MAAARKKKPLEPEDEAKVNELLGAVKRPRTLQDLHAALVALPRSGEAGAEAMRRLQPPFKNFGGATPGEDDEAISWDKTHLLVVSDEGLEGARLVPRRGAASEVPRSEERPRASNDGEELQERKPRRAMRASMERRAPRAPGAPPVRILTSCAVKALEARQVELEVKLRLLLVPKDPRDEKNVIMEIRAGAGGDEAGIFAADLFRLYTRYADGRGWKSDLLSKNDTGVGGFKEVILEIRGQGAYSRLKFESGVHRVQRVPTTESAGRIHTSTATVAVLAEVDEVEIEVPERDVKIDTYRASSAGGQNVQKDATAVRLTHIPARCRASRTRRVTGTCAGTRAA